MPFPAHPPYPRLFVRIVREWIARLLCVLVAALLVACGDAPAASETPDAAPCTAVTYAAHVDTDAGAPAVDAAAPAPMHYDVTFTPLVGGDVENATLRAMAAWEAATVGRVTFTAHNRTEDLPCTATLVYVDETKTAPAGSDDAVALHDFNACHTIVVVNPWASSEGFALAYSKLGVSPFVAVMSHELGHVLGLPHAATTEHSVMSPFVQLLPTAIPTCGDVAALGVLRGEPLPCFEAR